MNEHVAVPSTNQVIFWWEKRRLVFNAVLLIVGILTLIGFEIRMGKALPPGEDAEEPFGMFAGVLLYAVAANACYTIGWLSELWQRRTNVVVARQNARRNFRIGLAFSVILTSLPFWYACWFAATSRNYPAH